MKENFNVNSDVVPSGRHASPSGFSFLVSVSYGGGLKK